MGFPQKGDNYKEESPHPLYWRSTDFIIPYMFTKVVIKCKSVTPLLHKRQLIPLKYAGDREYRKETD